MSAFSNTSSQCKLDVVQSIRRCTFMVMVALVASGCATKSLPPPTAHVLSYIPSPADPYLADVRALLLQDGPSTGLQGSAQTVAESEHDANLAHEQRIGRRNALLTNYYVREELPFYRCSYDQTAPCSRPPSGAIPKPEGSPTAAPVKDRPWPAGIPRTCLALSGGGSRSAAFAIGVMQSLASAGHLDRVDVVSGVSGGGYALAWLIASKINTQASSGRSITTADLICEDSPAVKALTANSSLISPLYGLMAALTKPLDSALKAVLGADASADNSYWAAINATFTSAQCAKCPVDGQFKVASLAPEILRNQLPLPVFGLSARRQEDGRCDRMGQKRRELEETFFEVTPLRQGVFNAYSDSGIDLGLADTVALSGAAVSVPHAKYCDLVDAMGLALGSTWHFPATSHIPNPQQSETGSAAAPFTVSNTTHFLADGGHVENLGLYPLIQRLCQTIIVVDAEHDPLLEYEGLEIVEGFLKARHIEWESKLVNSAGSRPRDQKPVDGYAADRLVDPIFRGRLGPIAYVHAVETSSGQSFRFSNLYIDVHYLKLSIDGTTVPTDNCQHYADGKELDKEQYCLERKASMERHTPWTCSTFPLPLGNCPFPHYPTTRQNLSGSEVAALRALGRRLGASLFTPLR